jgi:hypothetical protein
MLVLIRMLTELDLLSLTSSAVSLPHGRLLDSGVVGVGLGAWRL